MILQMVIDDLDIRVPETALRPLETDPPPVVDADAVLTLVVALERFETVARQGGKISDIGCRLQSDQLEQSSPFDGEERPDAFSAGKIGLSLVTEADTHSLKSSAMSDVKHYIFCSDRRSYPLAKPPVRLSALGQVCLVNMTHF